MSSEKDRSIALLKKELAANPIEAAAPVYQPIFFGEFSDVKTSLRRKPFLNKYSLIFSHLEKELSGKSVIDVGANAGFFSFAAAQRGAAVDALEPSRRYYDLCVKLARIYGADGITFNNVSLSGDYLKGKSYDYGFFLSVLQWITEGNRRMDEGLSLLRELSLHVETLFFELGCNSGRSAIRTDKLNHLARVYRLLRENTVYGTIALIGMSGLWGPFSSRYIFLCSKKEVAVKEPFYASLKYINI